MTLDEQEEQRIVRIARALCRSARIDPDATIDDGTRPLLPDVPHAGAGSHPAWVAFRDSARVFAARHPREIVRSL
jgi:hypothetical protein